MQFQDDEKMNRRDDGEPKQFMQPLQAYDASLAHSNSSQEEYDQLEDQDEITTGLVGQLETMLAQGKMKYTTLVELG